jgi:hypothetical protein
MDKEDISIPNTVSFQQLLKVLNSRPLNYDDQYRNVYVIQLIQRLHILINQDRRRFAS